MTVVMLPKMSMELVLDLTFKLIKNGDVVINLRVHSGNLICFCFALILGFQLLKFMLALVNGLFPFYG